MGHRCADADGGEHHDITGILKHDLRETLAKPDHWTTHFADSGQCHCEQDGKRNNLEHIAPNHRVNYTGGKDMDDGFNKWFWGVLSNGVYHIRPCRDEFDVDTRVDQVHYRQSHKKRHGSDEL